MKAIRSIFILSLIQACAPIDLEERTGAERRNLRSTSSGDLKQDASQELFLGNVKSHWAAGACVDLNQDNRLEVDQQEVKLHGYGPHKIRLAGDAKIDLKLEFELCGPNHFVRNIVFVVDTSESMRSQYNIGNDPLVNGSCKRLDAVTSLIDNLPEGHQVRLGFTTFSTDVDKSSDTLMSVEDFVTDFLSAEFLCHRRLGTSGVDTNYTAGLAKAETMFAQTEDIASNEVFLITDGLPVSTATSGLNEAARLREDGLIGTILIGGGNDSILKDDIASTNSSGEPVHVSINAAENLGLALMDLANPETYEATFSYFTTEFPEGIEFDLDTGLEVFRATGMIPKDYVGDVDIVLKNVDSNGTEHRRLGSVEIIRE